MEVTNIYNLPDVLVRKCGTEKHNKEHCVSATTLKNGTRNFWLTERHWNEIKVDVSDMLWAMFGTAFHSLMEEETEDTFVEELVTKKIGNWTVTGRIDGYNMATCEIYDWKTTSVWKIVNKDFDAWRFQGLVYAWLCKQNGLEVKRCRFIACLKDQSGSKAKLDPSYPQHQVSVYEFDVTELDLEEIEKQIKAKVKEIADNENTPDEELPLCTPEERWAKPTTYAVMKKGRKSALRVFEDRELAEKYLEVNGDYIEERIGIDGKCNGYCSCCEFCSYWQEKYSKGCEEEEKAS